MKQPSFASFDRYGPYTDLEALCAYSLKSLRKSLRVNTLKSTVEAVRAWGERKGWALTPVPWCPEAFFVDREDRSVALGKDLLHLLGHVYMQEAASMLPVALLDPQPGECVLDMSAAPGSKTTQIAARMAGTGVIVANDVQEKRLWTLKNSLQRSGATDVIVTKKVGQWFARHMTERFDRVLCDAPCTAQGTVRKDSDALEYCGIDNIGKMARLQRELLESAIDACKTGGIIVYSTCTLTPEENEEVVASLLRKFQGQLQVVDPREQRSVGSGQKSFGLDVAIADSGKVQEWLRHAGRWPLSAGHLPLVRLWPQTYDTEGFFCAVLRKIAPTRHREKLPLVRFQEEELPRIRKEEAGKDLERHYGTTFLAPTDRLFARTDQLLLATEDVAEFRMPVADYSLGLPFALRLDGGRIRLSHETAILRGAQSTKNICVLGDKQLDDLLDGHDTTCEPGLTGDVLLLHKTIPVGVGLARDGKLKNRLPRWVVAKS